MHVFSAHRQKKDAISAQRCIIHRSRCCRLPYINALHDLSNILASVSLTSFIGELPNLLREKYRVYFEQTDGRSRKTIGLGSAPAFILKEVSSGCSVGHELMGTGITAII